MNESLKESKREQTGEGEMNKTQQDLKMDLEAKRKIKKGKYKLRHSWRWKI